MASEVALGTLAKSDGRETKHRGAHTRGLSQAWGAHITSAHIPWEELSPHKAIPNSKISQEMEFSCVHTNTGAGGNRFW